MSKIVTVQDISCYGSCSGTVALSILASRGHETAILPSAILSTHTGFKHVAVRDLTSEMRDILDCWEQEDIHFDAVYTGYIGNAEQFEIIDRLLGRLNPGGRLFTDPAMADHGRLYRGLDQTRVQGQAHLAAKADLILPNLTELCLLTGHPYPEEPQEEDIDLLKGMMTELSQKGPGQVAVTGIRFKGKEDICVLSYDRNVDSFSLYSSPCICRPNGNGGYHGTGDIFSAMTVASLLNGQSLDLAVKCAGDFVAEAIRNTINDPAHEYGVRYEELL